MRKKKCKKEIGKKFIEEGLKEREKEEEMK